MNQTAPLQKNWLEWLVFAAGAVLVAGVLGSLVFSMMTLGDAPPDLKIRLGKAQRAGDSFRVPVEIKNDGDQTAESVQIEVVLKTKTEEETSSFEAAFLPRHSMREGAVLFKTDPQTGTLEARVLGYEKP